MQITIQCNSTISQKMVNVHKYGNMEAKPPAGSPSEARRRTVASAVYGNIFVLHSNKYVMYVHLSNYVPPLFLETGSRGTLRTISLRLSYMQHLRGAAHTLHPLDA